MAHENMETDGNRTYYAYQINEEFSHYIVPVSAVVSLFAVTGILGNLFVLYVHIFKYQTCNFRYFVLGLCAVDLAASLTILPMEVFTHLHWYIFPNSELCKIKAFLNTFLSVSTVYVLLLIAIDRHRKICYPYSWQMTSRSVLQGYGVCFILTCIQSWIVILRFRKRDFQKEFHNTFVTVHICTTDPTLTIWRFLYIAAIVPYFLAMAVMLVLYCLVGRQVFGYVMKMRQQSQFRKQSRTSMGNKKMINSGLECKAKEPEISDDDDVLHSSSIIDDNLCKEVNATTQSSNELELVAYRVQENGIMFEKGTSVKRKGSDANRIRMTFEEKKKLEERSTNNRVSRIPDDAISGSHLESSKVCSTSESEIDRVKEEDSTSSLDITEGKVPKTGPTKSKVTKHVSLAERLTTRVKDLGQKTVNRTKKKVTFSGKARNKLRRRTLITFVFTTIFIVTNIIYLVISGNVYREHTMDFSELSFFLFIYRLYFINCVIHPIIYGMLDPKFKKTLMKTTRNVIESVRSRHDPDNKEN